MKPRSTKAIGQYQRNKITKRNFRFIKNSTKTKKDFDAVDSMGSIREKISKEIQGMTIEEEKEYLKKTY